MRYTTPHPLGMAFIVEKDKALDSVEISLVGSTAIVPNPDMVFNLLKKRGFSVFFFHEMFSIYSHFTQGYANSRNASNRVGVEICGNLHELPTIEFPPSAGENAKIGL